MSINNTNIAWIVKW